jgi:hypothetical protein
MRPYSKERLDIRKKKIGSFSQKSERVEANKSK